MLGVSMPVPASAPRRDALLVAAVTLAVFAPALANDWVEWDDRINFLDNPHYRGLGWRQIVWMFTVAWNGHWTPLAWLSLGLDYVLWGLNPVGYHLVNILWHAANAALFGLIAERLLRRVWPDAEATTLRLGAAAAALFFAVHPLRVESVAWATERRDLLSGFFYLLTVLAWLVMVERSDGTRRRWLAVALAAYALALLSKSIVISLPFVLLILDVYPLRRLTAATWRSPIGRAVLLEKVPFVLMAAALTALTMLTFRSMLASLQDYPPLARLAVACYGLAFYVWKTLVPADLSPIYELPWRVNLAEPAFLASALAVAVALVGLLAVRRRWPAGLAVAIAYALTLAPVSGVSQAGPQLVADRYSYLAMLGPALLLGGGVIAVAGGALGALRAGLVRLILGAVAVWLVVLAGLTVTQVRVWRDDRALWEHALAVNPDCAYCNAAYARYQAESGEAEGRFRRMLLADPGDVDARTRLGVVLVQSRRYGEAEVELRAAVRQAPDSPDALTFLGLALFESGRAAEALPVFERALALAPTAPLPHFGRGRALQALGRDAEVEPHRAALTRLEPRLAERLNRRW
jgi:tetratricopeptide (TPR) repeat protein